MNKKYKIAILVVISIFLVFLFGKLINKNTYSKIGKKTTIVFKGISSKIDDKIRQKFNSDKINSKKALLIKTYDGGNEPMHPKVLYFNNGWNGYKYWMCYTPYKNYDETSENPCIAVSNDGINWVTLKGLKNPLDKTDDIKKYYYSDPHLVFNSNTNKLECWYRRANSNNSGEIIYRKVSENGIDWAEKEQLFKTSGTVTGAISPSIIFDENKYKIWVSNALTDNPKIDRKLKYYESNDGTNWKAVRDISISTKKYNITHFDIIKTKKGYEFIGNTINRYNGHLSTLIYSVSLDNVNYSKPIEVLGLGDKGSWDSTRMYRPTLTYINGIYWIYYSAANGKDWGIGLIKVEDVANMHKNY